MSAHCLKSSVGTRGSISRDHNTYECYSAKLYSNLFTTLALDFLLSLFSFIYNKHCYVYLEKSGLPLKLLSQHNHHGKKEGMKGLAFPQRSLWPVYTLTETGRGAIAPSFKRLIF